ncbi:MAG: NUMOD4 domain-containing protein [Bacteroidota bacterium]
MYPYQENVLKLLPGEEWKDIPKFEEYYQASNLGRIRSVDRTIPHPRLGSQKVKGRILKQSIYYNKNTISEDKIVDLRVSLNLEGSSYYFNVRRLVYITFVKEIDFYKDGLYVINEDGDGFNCRLDNLKLVTKSDKSKRAFSKGRVPTSYLSTADRSKWIKPYGGQVRKKPIIQKDLQGGIVAKFDSVTQASKVTGIGEKEIIGVAKGRYKQWRGFKWVYAD